MGILDQSGPHPIRATVERADDGKQTLVITQDGSTIRCPIGRAVSLACLILTVLDHYGEVEVVR